MKADRFVVECWYKRVGIQNKTEEQIFQCSDKTAKFVTFAYFSTRKPITNAPLIYATVNGKDYYYHGRRRSRIDFNGVSETAERGTISASERVA